MGVLIHNRDAQDRRRLLHNAGDQVAIIYRWAAFKWSLILIMSPKVFFNIFDPLFAGLQTDLLKEIRPRLGLPQLLPLDRVKQALTEFISLVAAVSKMSEADGCMLSQRFGFLG